MRRLSITTPLLMCLALALTYGCQWTQARKAASSPLPKSAGVEVGQVAPDIEGDDPNGQHLRLADYRGKVVVLSFWSKA